MKPWHDQIIIIFCSRISGIILIGIWKKKRIIGMEERIIGGDFENARIEQ